MSYKDRLLQAARAAAKVQQVTVPDMDEPVYLRRMTGTERDRYEAAMAEFRDKTGRVDVMGNSNKITARLLVVGLGDEEGNRVFDDEDVDVIRQTFTWAAMDFLSGAVLRFNRLNTDAALDAAKN